MANITQYENPDNRLVPTETGIRADVQAAYRGGRFFSQLGSETEQTGNEFARNVSSSIRDVGATAVAYMDHEQISKGAEATAAYVAQKTKEWNDTVQHSDPNDPTVQARFMQGMNGDLEKLQNSMLTENSQKWMLSHTDAIRNHFNSMTTADMATVAGVAARNNAIKSVNSYSNAAVNDPGGIDNYMALAKDAIHASFGSSPNLKGAAGIKAESAYTEKAMEQIVHSGAMSAIMKSNDPEATASQFIAKYPEYMKGEQALAIAKAARGELRYRHMLDRQTIAANKAIELQKGNDWYVQHVVGAITPSGELDAAKAPVILKEFHDAVGNGSINFTPALADHIMSLSSKVDKVSNPDIKADLWNKFYLHELDPTAVYEAANKPSGQGISHSDAAALIGAYKNVDGSFLNTPEIKSVLAGAKSELVVPTAYSDFMQHFAAIVRKHEWQPGDMNFKDPTSKISKLIQQFEPTQAQKIQYQTMKNIGLGIDPNLALKPGSVLGTPTNLRAFIGQGLEYNETTKQYRVNGKTYDASGQEIK